MSMVGSSNRHIGATGALHVQLAVGRPVRPGLAGALTFDAYWMDTMSSIPGCALPEPDEAPRYCGERTERAGGLLGVAAEARWFPWHTIGLAVTGGLGAYWSPGVRGPVSSRAAGVSAGLEFQSASSEWSPMIGVRARRLLSDAGGIRWMVSPTLGLRF
jgi:hypothetical protein